MPVRRFVNGTRPGITGEDPLGAESGSQEQWEFPSLGKRGLTKEEKKMVVAQVAQKSVLAIFKTHSKKFYLQKRGGPIGLRSTCCIARLVMLWWDQEFLDVVKTTNIKIIGSARYMDDVRVWLRAIRLGWRWQDGRLVFKSKWRMEELQAGMSILQKTSDVLQGMMNSICCWLKLTMEHEEMFGGVLPTLDLELWVSKENKILFSFFLKGMISPMVLHKRSAMPEGVRRATLNQELIRRMVNTSELVDMNKRLEIVDKYAQKLIHSEYSMDETIRVVIGGLKGYERLLSLSKDIGNPKWKPLHMAGNWNGRNRRMAKLRSRDNW